MGVTDKMISKEVVESENEKKMFADNNERKKQQLISEIKSGLGVNIMKNPGKPKIIKKTKNETITDWFRKIFNKF
jgi:hypothetical protein